MNITDNTPKMPAGKPLPQLSNLSPETRQAIVSDVTTKYREWRAIRVGRENEWREADQQYNQYMPGAIQPIPTQDDDPTRAQTLMLSNVYAMTEGVVAQAHNKLFADEYNFFTAISADAATNASTEPVETALKHVMAQQNFKQMSIQALRNCVKYGTSISRYAWQLDKAVIRKAWSFTDSTSNQTTMLYDETPTTTYNAPKLDVLDIYRTVIDPAETDVTKAMLIHEKWLEESDILNNGVYKISTLEKAGAVASAERPGINNNYAIDHRAWAQGDTTSSSSHIQKDRFVVYEAWGNFYIKGVLYQNYVVEVCGRVLVRFEPNPTGYPTKPFLIARYNPQTGTPYGMSAIKSVMAESEVYNTLVRQMIDYNTKELEAPWLMDVSRVPSMSGNTDISRALVWDQHTIIPVNNMLGNTTPVIERAGGNASSNPVAASFPLLEMLLNQMHSATNDTPTVTGGQPDRYVTTGNAVMASDAGNNKLSMYISTFEHEFIIPALYMTWNYMLSNLSGTIVLSTTLSGGQQGQQVFNPGEWQGQDLKFTFTGSTGMANKQAQAQGLMAFFQLVAGSPILSQFFDLAQLGLEVAKTQGVPNPEHFLTPQAKMGMVQSNMMSATSGLDQAVVQSESMNQGVGVDERLQMLLSPPPVLPPQAGPPPVEQPRNTGAVSGAAQGGSSAPARFDNTTQGAPIGA